MVQSIAFNYAGTGVRINALCLGIIDIGATSIVIEAVGAGGSAAPIREMNPLQRWAQADEIARVFVFRASDKASYVNGQAWDVRGGFTSGHQRVAGIPAVHKP